MGINDHTQKIGNAMQAGELLRHYFRVAGVNVGGDSAVEINHIVDHIIDAAVSAVRAEDGRRESLERGAEKVPPFNLYEVRADMVGDGGTIKITGPSAQIHAMCALLSGTHIFDAESGVWLLPAEPEKATDDGQA